MRMSWTMLKNCARVDFLLGMLPQICRKLPLNWKLSLVKSESSAPSSSRILKANYRPESSTTLIKIRWILCHLMTQCCHGLSDIRKSSSPVNAIWKIFFAFLETNSTCEIWNKVSTCKQFDVLSRKHLSESKGLHPRLFGIVRIIWRQSLAKNQARCWELCIASVPFKQPSFTVYWKSCLCVCSQYIMHRESYSNFARLG